MIQAGILGGTGFTGAELLRILVNHPYVKINWIYSRSNSIETIHDIHPDLDELGGIKFVQNPDFNVDVIFMCFPHGVSGNYLKENRIPYSTKIIDLSNEFRWKGQNFIYGLPELQRDEIKMAVKVANPGCFATAIQLALLPLAKNQAIHSDVHISAITGSTGAGKKALSSTHFSWRHDNLSTYKVLKHQHIPEIIESLKYLQRGLNADMNFIPYRGNHTRGIISSVYLKTSESEDTLKNWYTSFYKDHPFTIVSEKPIDMKQVVNTNKAKLFIEKIDGYVYICSVIDNLLKGASGQAVQNMNLMFNIPETTGLELKSIAY